jgi:hypothetical protein
VRVDVRRAASPDEVVGHAVWNGTVVRLEAEEDDVRTALSRIFRATPVATDDPSYRPQGTHGEVVIQPGSLVWFRAAAFVRAPDFDLVARVVPGVREGGWDPAAQYERFPRVIDRLERAT